MYDSIISVLETRNKVILVHGNADMDAIGSAYAISECFGNATIVAYDGVDKVSRSVAEKLNIKIIEEYEPKEDDLFVVVDSSSPEQLKIECELPKSTIIFDHHIPSGRWDEYQFFCDTSKVACVQLVYDMLKETKKNISKNVSLALLCGMITDSGHFVYANPVMFDDFSELMKMHNITMDEVFALTNNDATISERIAILKSIEKSRFERVGEMIVATSIGGSFEASCCKALLSAGADVAFVGTQRDENFRISARAHQTIVKKGINLGEIVGSLGRETSTDAGGHSGAAGVSGIGDVEAMLHICKEKVMAEFKKIKNSAN